jgi:replicative DNA helicase
VQPLLHHIREADDLANDAAGVLSLHRPAEKTGRTRPDGSDETRDGKVVFVRVVKNRDGQRGGEFSLDFAGEFNHLAERPDNAAHGAATAAGLLDADNPWK